MSTTIWSAAGGCLTAARDYLIVTASERLFVPLPDPDAPVGALFDRERYFSAPPAHGSSSSA